MTDMRIDEVRLAGERPLSPVGVRVWTCLGLAATCWLIFLSGAWLIVEIASAVLPI